MDPTLKEILAEFVTDKTKLTPQARLKEDLGIDSYALLDLYLSIGISYNIDPNPYNFLKIKTVGDIENYLSDKTV